MAGPEPTPSEVAGESSGSVGGPIDASAYLDNISRPGVFTHGQVQAVWSRIRAIIAGTGRKVPTSINNTNVVPFVTFFIINSSSSRQPSDRRIIGGDFDLTVGDVLHGCGHRLRQFLRFYSDLAEQIIIGTPYLAATQSVAYGLFNEQTRYAFDFLDLSRLHVGANELKRLRAAIDEKIANEMIEDVPADVTAALSAPSVRQSIAKRNVPSNSAPQG